MPQTVAMVRGTTVIAPYTPTTIYTQSGGIATRVIINMIAAYGTSGLSSPYFDLYYTSSSGGNSVIGYFKSNASMTSIQLMPANNGFGPIQVGGNSGSVPMTGAGGGNVGTVYPGTISPFSWNVYHGSDNRMSYCPSNLWMGPSDTLGIACVDNNSANFQFAWSFTTITES